jgi:hypothetical protein
MNGFMPLLHMPEFNIRTVQNPDHDPIFSHTTAGPYNQHISHVNSYTGAKLCLIAHTEFVPVLNLQYRY